ncbi:MAG: tRNA 2-thiouridine(34) synthase MnmA [Alphaproteobacteria bacterium]
MIKPIASGKAPKDTRVAVAMSGGVDSSVAAAVLKDQGYDVVGLTMQLYDHGEAVRRKGACCAGEDIHDARRVAAALDMPHFVLDYESRFKESVMDDFVDAYVRGETPIPCVKCNETVKFKDMLDQARDLGAEALATGHYVQRLDGAGGAELHRGADTARDQSYFLFTTTQAQLDFLHFPLGHVTKPEVRAIADRLGLEVANKPDSQDICFVPDGKYSRLVERLRPDAMEPGDMVHMDGRVLGRHDGIAHFTIGQRRGLGISTGEPVFVVDIDADTNRVLVGPREALAVKHVLLRDLNWLGDTPPSDAPLDVLVRLRSTSEPVPATVQMDGTTPVITLSGSEFGVSPGQAGVFYDVSAPTRCLGGGWISGTRTALGA